MSKILIFRGGALGDFILTLPAITALRQRWPLAHIELVGHPCYANLGLTAKLITKVRSFDDARLALYFQNAESLPEDEKKYVRSFDLIVSFLHDPDGVLLSQLKNAGAKDIIAASPIIEKGHAADHFLKAAKNVVGGKFGQTVAAKTWPHFIKCGHRAVLPEEQFLLKWPLVLKEKARRRLSAEIGEKKAIIIHPGSGSPAKNWPAEKFAALAKKIRKETDFEPLIIGGEADTKPTAVMHSLLPGFHFFDNLSLVDIASLISISVGFAGNDSGITHLAAALGIPVVALFGPTDPAIWAPHGKNVFVIKSKSATTKSLAGITVKEVFQKIIELKLLDSGRNRRGIVSGA